MPDYQALKHHLEYLSVLLEIKARRDEEKREDELALLLIALLMTWYDDRNADAFRMAFLATLSDAYDKLDARDEYGELIDKELAVQSGYLTGFIQDLRNGTITEAQARARAKSYARSLGKLWNRIELEKESDINLRWVMGENENHCSTCPTLHNKVKPASTWAYLGLYPKCSLTDCDGSCLCHFEEA